MSLDKQRALLHVDQSSNSRNSVLYDLGKSADPAASHYCRNFFRHRVERWLSEYVPGGEQTSFKVALRHQLQMINDCAGGKEQALDRLGMHHNEAKRLVNEHFDNKEHIASDSHAEKLDDFNRFIRYFWNLRNSRVHELLRQKAKIELCAWIERDPAVEHKQSLKTDVTNIYRWYAHELNSLTSFEVRDSEKRLENAIREAHGKKARYEVSNNWYYNSASSTQWQNIYTNTGDNTVETQTFEYSIPTLTDRVQVQIQACDNWLDAAARYEDQRTQLIAAAVTTAQQDGHWTHPDDGRELNFTETMSSAQFFYRSLDYAITNVEARKSSLEKDAQWLAALHGDTVELESDDYDRLCNDRFSFTEIPEFEAANDNE